VFAYGLFFALFICIQAFGNNFQRPPPLQPGQGAYLAAQINYRGGYHNNNNNNYYSNSGYGYYSGGRGRGRNTHFWPAEFLSSKALLVTRVHTFLLLALLLSFQFSFLG